MFRTLTHSEPYLDIEAYSKPWYIQENVQHLRWNVLQKLSTPIALKKTLIFSYFRKRKPRKILLCFRKQNFSIL